MRLSSRYRAMIGSGLLCLLSSGAVWASDSGSSIDPTKNPEDFERAMAGVIFGWWEVTDENSTQDAMAGQFTRSSALSKAIDAHVANWGMEEFGPGPNAAAVKSIVTFLREPTRFDKGGAARDEALAIADELQMYPGVDQQYKEILRDMWQTRHAKLMPSDPPDAFLRMIFDIQEVTTLCEPNEMIMWSCNRDGRIASLCGQQGSGVLQFRLGTTDAVEISAPPVGTPAKDVFAVELYASDYAATLTHGDTEIRLLEFSHYDTDKVSWRRGSGEGSMTCGSTHDQLLDLYTFGVR